MISLTLTMTVENYIVLGTPIPRTAIPVTPVTVAVPKNIDILEI
jgi:hypothetical protein